MNPIRLRQLLHEAFEEDIGTGDLSSELLFSSDVRGSGTFLMRQDGVLAGLDVIEEGYRILDESVSVDFYTGDGSYVKEGEEIAEVEGPMRVLLSGERVILNLLQHACGIATRTHTAVQALGSDHTRICDTRKTLPGYRMLDKYAVRCGGGYNHRMGLDDGVILKDNHIAKAGGIREAVRRVRDQAGHMVNIEVEVEAIEQVREAVDAGADIVMFDNRSPKEVKNFVQEVPDEIVTEVSGGINIETLPDYRDTGVDYISMGMLTHSVEALDISFNVSESQKGS